jgi:alpha-L-rhamnosidase
MNSFNHYSLGSVGQWLYEHVAGIRAGAPGYAHVVIAPEPGGLEWARAVHRSVRGPISSAWRRDGDTLELEVEIPANVTATVIVPGGEPVEVGSGRHAFTHLEVPSDRELVRARSGSQLGP